MYSDCLETPSAGGACRSFVSMRALEMAPVALHPLQDLADLLSHLAVDAVQDDSVQPRMASAGAKHVTGVFQYLWILNQNAQLPLFMFCAVHVFVLIVMNVVLLIASPSRVSAQLSCISKHFRIS